jgi:phage recombination protein Bet
MSTATKPKNEVATKPAQPSEAIIYAPRLAYHPGIEQKFGIDKTAWKPLVEAIFPNAQTTDAVILALSYCKARKLDPFKRCVHIVPIYNRDMKCMVDTIWPGIGELRTTAFRTGEYAGRSETVFGPDITQKVGSVEITYPEFAQVTLYRMIKGQRVEFAGPRVYWIETYATVKRDDDSPNDMWRNRPRGQIDKCAEAAALRAAFPEEVGGDYCAEEINSFAKGGPVIEHKAGKPMASLEDLSDKYEQPKPTPQPEVEQETETETEELAYRPDFLDAARVGFDECDSNDAVSKWFEHQTVQAHGDEEHSQLTAMAAAARKRLKGSK